MAKQPKQPASIMITGASSGIGAALARAYAGPGMFLAISGRDLTRLNAVAEELRAKGATVDARVIDVRDGPAMAAWVLAIEAARPLDLVIANAGVAASTLGEAEKADDIRHVLSINVNGTVETVLAVLPAMKARGRGQIAIMSSLAGLYGFPGASAYCASRAATRIWGQSLRAELRPAGIQVSVICPGFVETRMTAKSGLWMPGRMGAMRAAGKIIHGLKRDRARIAFPWWMHFGTRLMEFMPERLATAWIRREPSPRNGS